MVFRSAFLVSLVVASFSFSEKRIVSGSVSGRWNAYDTIVASSQLTVSGELTIEKGVVVLFAPGVGIEAGSGKLIVKGERNALVTFTADLGVKTPGAWSSISISNNTTMDTIKYAKIEYAQNGILVQSTPNWACSDVFVAHSEISECGSGLVAHVPTSSAVLATAYIDCRESRIHHNKYGIWLSNSTKTDCAARAFVFVSNSTIDHNEAGILLSGSNNYISIVTTNTTFANNQTAINVEGRGNATIRNSLFSYNQVGIRNTGFLTGENIQNSLLFLNDTNFIGVTGSGFGTLNRVNAHGDSADSYLNILSSDPLLDTIAFSIQKSSPAVDAGNYLGLNYSSTDKAVSYSFVSYDADGSLPDIGAYRIGNTLQFENMMEKLPLIQVGGKINDTLTIYNDYLETEIIILKVGDDSNEISLPGKITIPGHRISNIPFTITGKQTGNKTVKIIVKSENARDSILIHITCQDKVESTIYYEFEKVTSLDNDTVIVGIDVKIPEGDSLVAFDLAATIQTPLNIIRIDTIGTSLGKNNFSVSFNKNNYLLSVAGEKPITSNSRICNFVIEIPSKCEVGDYLINAKITSNDEKTLSVCNSGNVDVYCNRTLGDIDQNGSIQAFDASLILRYIVGLDSFSKCQIVNAQVTNDTVVTTLNASTILAYCTNKISKLPAMIPVENVLGKLKLMDVAMEEYDTVAMPIALEKSSHVNGIYAEIKFDPKKLEFIGTTDRIVAQADGEKIKVAMADDEDINNGVVGQLYFRPLTELSVVYLKKFKINNLKSVEVLDSATIFVANKTFGLLNSAPIIKCLPNNHLQLSFYASYKKSLIVNMFDIHGRLVKNIYNQPVLGKKQIDIMPQGFANGSYLIRIKYGDQSFIKKYFISR